MNEYKKSLYAINKVRKGIAYRNADGSVLEVTFEKIAQSNPTFTEDDFRKLKELSDDLFHDEEKADNLYGHYVKASLNECDENRQPATISAEEQLIIDETVKEENSYVRKLQQAIDTQLTPVQKKRLYLNCFRGMTVREIAKIEGSHYTTVAESIGAAKKKIKKNFDKFLRNTPTKH